MSVVQFVNKNKKGEYRIGNVKSLPARTFGNLEDSDKKNLQVAILTPEQYKALEGGKTLKNQDLGFYSEEEVVNAVNEVSILKANEAEYLKAIEEQKKQIEANEAKYLKEIEELKKKAQDTQPKEETTTKKK